LCLLKGLVPNTPTLALAATHVGLPSEHQSSNITIYSTLQGGCKKRKLSQDGGTPGSGANGNSNGATGGQQQGLNSMVHVKQEPGDFIINVIASISAVTDCNGDEDSGDSFLRGFIILEGLLWLSVNYLLLINLFVP